MFHSCKKQHFIALLLPALAFAPACQIFEDLTPENVFFRMEGEAGSSVQLVLSTEFVAGVNEIGVTQVQVFRSDTVVIVLPADTIISIARYRQFFLEAAPLSSDMMNVSVLVEIDGRKQVEESGNIFRISPWRYVYVFNQPLTRSVEVVL